MMDQSQSNPLNRQSFGCTSQGQKLRLSSKAIQSPALPLQGVHNIHGSHSLPLGVLGVGDSIADDVLQEHLENTPGLLIDETTDPLDTAPPRKAPDCRLGDALNVIPQHLAMPLGTSLAQALSPLPLPVMVDACYLQQCIGQ